MFEYTRVLRNVLRDGYTVVDRTGTGTLALPGQVMSFDLRHGFPLLTLRQVPYKSVFAELLGFLNGYTSAQDFRKLGTRIWDANANENKAWLANPFRKGEDDLGRVYGANWRGWQAFAFWSTPEQRNKMLREGWRDCTSEGMMHKGIDQMQQCVDQLRDGPGNRRVLFHGWNPAELHEMALPPCHLLYQFHRYGKDLHLSMYIRSNDLGLGAPFNIASGAALLQMFADMSGCRACTLTIHIGDAHVYADHLIGMHEMLLREESGTPQLPTLDISYGELYPVTASLDEVVRQLTVDSFEVRGYEPLPAISLKMSV